MGYQKADWEYHPPRGKPGVFGSCVKCKHLLRLGLGRFERHAKVCANANMGRPKKWVWQFRRSD